MTLLEIRSLKKQYKEITAVNDLSFKIEEGEVLGLLGPNGAGKTTAISIISTLIKANDGEVLYKGENIAKHPGKIQRDLGFVPQEIALFTTLTAYDNLMFWGKAYGLKGVTLKKKAKGILERIGLEDRGKDKVETFSGGMKRRLNIGAALLHEPSIVIMDEPTVGIDPQSRQYILDIVKDLNDKGSTIIYTSHYMEEVEQLCNKIIIMDHGKIIASGTKSELLDTIDEGEQIVLKIQGSRNNLIKKLSDQAYVLNVEIKEDSDEIVVHTKKNGNISHHIVNTLSELNINILSLEIRKPSLESVFLHLTGRTLRD
ncbi:ABC transporter ATP-binding protein [Vallitalea okinawensis]|uniref:ABC transporter ATP-binding protein n=1 Tax=Vallitalea okinawensis TaxID=2078660 RepID=UPI000CFD1F7F|nr:ABC transporter ATP-binding protein [Vallitalea okinawensis]